MERRLFVGVLAGGAAASGGVPCRLVDARTGKPLSARVRLTDSAGREVAPLGRPGELSETAQEGDVRFQSRRFSYVDGRFEVDPRALPLRFEVVKGYEYRIASGEIKDAAGAVIRLDRWSTVGKSGWRGGDVHIHHIAPKTCRLEMDAEDLDVANILTSDFTEDQREFEGRLNSNSSGGRLIYVTQEFRNHQLGHLCVLNLKKLIEPVKPAQETHYPLHLTAVYDQVKAQGGYVSWAHFPSWPGVEGPLDVVMEKLESVELLCVLDPHTFPVFTRQVVPEVESNDGLRLWYRYLNCGFRLTPTAGTDKMTNYVTVGANRVYARVGGEFTYQGWIDALRAGRTFVTNSPMLRLEVNGREPGSTINLAARAGQVEVRAEAESQLPYDRLEIVVNGRVVADATPSGPLHRARIGVSHPVKESCWVAARAIEDPAPYRARGVEFSKIHVTSGTRLSDYYGTRRPETVFAHTSPVYVLLGGRAIRSRDDADYYIRYMDKSIAWLEKDAKFAKPADKEATLEAFRQGRARWVSRRDE